MCWDDEPQETDQEEHDRIVAEREAELARQRIIQEQQAAAARRAQAAKDAATAAERRARTAAESDLPVDDEDMLDEEGKKKRKARGISALRIDRTASSLGGTPVMGAGLTVA